ncbi:MAG TPA: ABC transporter substrate-binding protein [Casimicrobiaceae bacterium]|nr:ABC transporter substrate-binding protein [Casimicrobiaceae bacterium]
MRSRWFTRSGLFAMALGLCAANISAQTPTRGGTLSVGFSADTKTLDPALSVQFSERQVLYLVFNTLVKYGTDFSLKPELAQSWEIKNDGKQIVFKLRPGVKFHDGTVFDATAVKWNIDHRLDEAAGSPQRQQLAPIIESVTVVDPMTVAFNLKQPAPGLLGLLGERPGFMMSPAAAQKLGKEFGSNPVGTGPFVFKEWVRGSNITVERNPAYWESGKPYLDRIVFRDISDAVVGTQRLITGELDFVGELSPTAVTPLKGRAGIKLLPITVGRWYSLQWRMDKPPFDNAKLRQAIAYSIDRKRLNDIVMAGQGSVSDGPTPPGLWWYDASIKSYPYDPDKAKALLKEAGYPNGFEFVLSTPQVSDLQRINQLVQEQTAAIGIKLTLAPVAASEWYAKLVDGSTNMSPNRWTQRPDPDGLLYILFHSKGFANTARYKNEKVDALLDEARLTYDQEKRKKLYSEAQRIIVADSPMLSLFFSVEYAAMRDTVQNFEWIPDQIPRFADVWKSK